MAHPGRCGQSIIIKQVNTNHNGTEGNAIRSAHLSIFPPLSFEKSDLRPSTFVCVWIMIIAHLRLKVKVIKNQNAVIATE